MRESREEGRAASHGSVNPRFYIHTYTHIHSRECLDRRCRAGMQPGARGQYETTAELRFQFVCSAANDFPRIVHILSPCSSSPSSSSPTSLSAPLVRFRYYVPVTAPTLRFFPPLDRRIIIRRTGVCVCSCVFHFRAASLAATSGQFFFACYYKTRLADLV